MEPPVSRFRDEVVKYLSTDVLPAISNDYQQYLGCEAKPLGEEQVRIQNLQFIRRNADGGLELVNNSLSNDRLVFAFHFEDSVQWDDWRDLLVEFTLKTECHHLETPYAVKWERTGTLGQLKADERFDTSQTYIRQRIGPRETMRVALEVILHDYLPSDLDRLTTTTEIPIIIKRMYDDQAEEIDSLKSTNP